MRNSINVCTVVFLVSFIVSYGKIHDVTLKDEFSPGTVHIDLKSTPKNTACLKFFDNSALTNENDAGISTVRYADILLSKAEALNELYGDAAEVCTLINTERERVGISDLTVAAIPAKDDLYDAIFMERCWEFLSEDEHREDLIRRSKFIVSAQKRNITNTSSRYMVFLYRSERSIRT